MDTETHSTSKLVSPVSSEYPNLWLSLGGRTYGQVFWTNIVFQSHVILPGIPGYDGEVPPAEAVAQFAYGYTVRPNDTATTG